MSELEDPDLVIAYWKPHGTLTAFTDTQGRRTLADDIDVPDVYAAGRLDRDSEGLLVLTRSRRLRTALMDPTIGHPRRYLVQVEGVPDPAALEALRSGIVLRDGPTRPAEVQLLTEPPALPERTVPVRVRLSVPDCWLHLTLTEGRNRQVRRMTAAVGHPTLRLVRDRIGPISLDGLEPRSWRVVSSAQRADLRAGLAELSRRAGESPSRRGHGRRRRGRR